VSGVGENGERARERGDWRCARERGEASVGKKVIGGLWREEGSIGKYPPWAFWLGHPL
jgi:hypothetical protein